MTSAQGGGEGGTQKEDENGQGGEGGKANLDVIFLDDINSALPLQSCPKKIYFDRMESLLTIIQYFVFSNDYLLDRKR